MIGIARHSETEERLVVYRCLYGDCSLRVCPLSMSIVTVTVDGKEVPRFRHLDEEDGNGSPAREDGRGAWSLSEYADLKTREVLLTAMRVMPRSQHTHKFIRSANVDCRINLH